MLLWFFKMIWACAESIINACWLDLCTTQTVSFNLFTLGWYDFCLYINVLYTNIKLNSAHSLFLSSVRTVALLNKSKVLTHTIC